MATTPILVAADAVDAGLSGAVLASHGSKGGASTVVTIAIGSPANAGGPLPHVALWDKDGNRIGQYRGDKKKHVDSSGSQAISVDHNENGGKEVTAEYASIVMNEGGALCISSVEVTGNDVDYVWLGELGKYCGAQWFPSTRAVGSDTNAPACIWLDQAHKVGCIAQGFSLHMPDFAPNDARTQQYTDNPDTLCKSTERMTFWPSIVADDIPGFFKPPLKYTNPGKDDPVADLEAVAGADEDIKRVVDRKQNAYPDSFKKPSKRDRLTKRENNNLNENHLVISDHLGHSAKEVCEDPNSLGWDFVSTSEGVFCDLSAREWWPVCSEAVTNGCFDLDKKAMRGNAPGHKEVSRRDVTTGRVMPEKNYDTSEKWDA